MQLVCFVDDIEKASFGDVIVVVNNSTTNDDRIEDNPKRGASKMCTVVLQSSVIFFSMWMNFFVLFCLTCPI